MKYDLTLKKIKKTNFSLLYNKFIIGDNLSYKQYESLLAIAICFINADSVEVQRLGYRIIVEYCNQKNNYIPLYEITINKGLYPISKFISEHFFDDRSKTFFTEWNNAFMEQFSENGIYKSEQQKLLTKFFSDNTLKTLSVIAPTSYGKSELIVSAVKEFADKKICILVSTKALLMQTKKRILDECRDKVSKVIVHPEMYNSNDKSCVAVLTQERLLRLLKIAPELSFDCVVVDEAHEVLDNNNRSHMLSSVIIFLQKRNPDIVFKFLTPFIMDADNLKMRYTTYDIDSFKVCEYIKTEKYFFCDIKNGKGISLYDQFLDEFIDIPNSNFIRSEEGYIKNYCGTKNIIYLNKPVDIEEFALSLADSLPDLDSTLIDIACKNISEYLDKQYNLIRCLKKGIIYHHGSVPDVIRYYIEDIYKNCDAVKYIISSSTLLSGVNLPAEKMFILDNRKGSHYLHYDAFKNLVGRVCRFSEIFNRTKGNLNNLEPQIYILFGKYFLEKANCKKYLSSVAKVEKKFEDKVENILLKNSNINREKEESLKNASEFIENYERGVIENYKYRYILTDIGKICIMNGITEINIFDYEKEIERRFRNYENIKINNEMQMLDIIQEVFLNFIDFIDYDKKNHGIKRLRNEEARKFYAMILNWRINNKSYSEMIASFVGYWNQPAVKNGEPVFVGKWGDITYGEGKAPHYTRMKDKSYSEMVNLAIVRIKEEQDFVDNFLMKYIEVLNDLEILEEDFYLKIKYGTINENIIYLIKNGLSLSAATLLYKKYREYLNIDIQHNMIHFNESLIDAMNQNRENRVLIYEIENCI